MFEIAHSLARQFGLEQWTLYKGMHLFSFADNHDVTRIASILQDKKQLDALYAVLFCMPGIPCVYYGSEWGAQGEKHQGDPALRPCFEKPLEKRPDGLSGQAQPHQEQLRGPKGRGLPEPDPAEQAVDLRAPVPGADRHRGGERRGEPLPDGVRL